MEKNFRKCFVLREVEVPMESLKKGDVFRLAKASPTDCVDEVEWALVDKDAIPCDPPGNHIVEATILAFVANHKHSVRFT